MLTTLYGLLGYPVHHSVSPQMMNEAFGASSIDAIYVALAVHPLKLGDALRGLEAIGAGGLNITIPHKERVFSFLQEVSEEAKLARAVNTLVRDTSGAWVGHNTDISGWWDSARALVSSKSPRTVTVFGAGGAARAVLSGLALHCPDIRVCVAARRDKQSTQLAADFDGLMDVGHVSWDTRQKAASGSDWLIQTTPVGMWPDSQNSVIEDETCLFAGQIVQDIVYRPLETKVLAAARRRGAIPIDGLAMLVGQGASAFELWTGQEAPVALMRQAALTALN